MAELIIPRKKLQHRILQSFISLVVGIMAVVFITVTYILVTELRSNITSTLTTQSNHTVQIIAQRVHYLNQSVSIFSRNHFIINSLVHPQGREDYHSKMLNYFGKRESIYSI